MVAAAACPLSSLPEGSETYKNTAAAGGEVVVKQAVKTRVRDRYTSFLKHTKMLGAHDKKRKVSLVLVVSCAL